ncbi:nuclear valosin-containing protein-like isoform X3 [Nycticebus coucang]|uniref:nuclear valosin-containing protein-like isoform X3 n=1 Tax=Nycticebus coucang TaxID=9470 RepID=UPI00234D0695|nr:nuclear valosin-containing protein-like isoform X3 [Nycticebus coucang]
MKPRPAGFVDNKLKQRVIQYLTSNRCGKYVDIGVLASDLQRIYRYTESSSSDDSNMEDRPDPQSANHMNSSLLSLYRKGKPDSVSTTSEMEQRKLPASTPRITSKTNSISLKMPAGDSEGGWFIDKTPGGKKDSFFLELSCEKSNYDKPITEIQHLKDSCLLESDKKRKGRLRSKGRKRKKEDIQEVDGEIEALLQKKAKARGLEFQISSVKFEDVGGNDKTLKEVCKMLVHMRHPEVYHHLGVVPPRGVLLHGPPGCGKTLLAHAIAGELDLPILKVAAPEIVSGVSGESEQKLRELFEQAVSNAPCIIFIDEIDAITPKREVASKDMERRIVAQLLTCMDDLNNVAATARVLVIGATNRPDSLDPALRRAGRFDREICLGIPDEASRERILQTLCRKLRLPEDFNFCHIAHLTPGFVGADLMALCREAAMCAVNRVLMKQQKKEPEIEGLLSEKGQEERLKTEPTSETQDELQRLLGLLRDQDPLSKEQMQGLCIELNDFIVALSSVQPSAKREGFVTVPNVTWADIGALEDIREELTMAILAPVRNPDQFKALGLVTPAGILLAGPPGCGKTLLAKAVANESGLNFISVKGPELLNMYVGESERAVRQVFQRAKNSAPCVIFFDEMDALCPRRSDRETGASVRVVNQLLTEMDGLETRQQVFIMAATNRPDIIDPAILRPGRLDKTLFVGLPPPADRLAILKTITKNGTRPPLDADVNLEAIAGDLRCDCYTGADLSALVREASICALRQEMARQKSGNEKGSLKISHKHFEEAFKKVKPSISKKACEEQWDKKHKRHESTRTVPSEEPLRSRGQVPSPSPGRGPRPQPPRPGLLARVGREWLASSSRDAPGPRPASHRPAACLRPDSGHSLVPARTRTGINEEEEEKAPN